MTGHSTTPPSAKAVAARLLQASRLSLVECRLDGERVIHPVGLLLGLALIAALAVVLEVAEVPRLWSQRLIALVLVLGGGTAVALSPVNGLMLLFLVPPLANGEADRPYFSLLEALVYLTLAAGVAWRLRRRRPVTFPHARFLLLFLALTALSLPLSLRELVVELQVLSWRDILEGVRRSELAANLFYVRTVLNVASGIALYVLVVNERWTRETLLRIAVAVTILGTVVTSIGFLLHWLARPMPPGGTVFLTVYLGGSTQGGFMGLGFNQSLFAQYALAYLPLVAYVFVQHPARLARLLSLTMLVLSGFAIMMTYQRGAYLVLLLEAGFLLWAGRSLGAGSGVRAGPPLLGAAAAVTGALAGLVLVPALRAAVVDRLEALWVLGDPVRTHLLQVGWQMVREYPLLGIGTGRFAHLFQFYSSTPTMQWGHWSAHNLYAQFLAEQGVLGLGSFLALLAASLVPILRGQRRLGEERGAVLFLLVSLGAWLAYGWLQYTFVLRSMQLYFWLTLGLLVSLTSPVGRAPRPARRWGIGLALLVLVLLGARLHTVLAMPAPFTTDRYVLTRPEGAQGEVIVSAEGHAVIPVVPRAVQGWVDGWDRVGGRAVVTGWAGDPEHSEPAGRILVFVDDRLFAVQPTNLMRNDVVAHFGKDSLVWSGFRFAFSAALFADGRREVRFFGVSPRGVASELQYASGYRWARPSPPAISPAAAPGR